MEIYIDIFFLINFISDFSLLLLCDIKYTDKKSVIRKLIGAIWGSIYSCLFVFDIPPIIYSFTGKIIAVIVMCFISFYPRKAVFLLEKCITFLIVSVLFCGVFYVGSVTFENPLFCFNISDTFWILSLSSGFLMIRFILFKIKKTLYSKSSDVIICYNNKAVHLKGLIDSGNCLSEPLTKMPVLVIDENVLKELFSPSVTKNNLCEFVNSKDFRVIPYKTISDEGITYGFIPQKFIYEGKEIKNIIIAVAPSPISSDILISPQII